MIHLYEVDGGPYGTFWDIYDMDHEYIRTIHPDKLEDLLQVYRVGGLDFCLHTLAEYEEYHLALGRS